MSTDEANNHAAQTPPPKCQTAFLVVLNAKGEFEYVVDLKGVAMDRPATLRDVTRGCHEILDDIAALRAGVETVNMQVQQIRRAQLSGGAPGPIDPHELMRRLKRSS